MTSRIRACAARATTAITAVAAIAAGAAAQAHTGHGHDELGTFEGLLHALREPDHLAMLALGIIVIGATSPFALRAALWLGRRVAEKVRGVRRLRQARLALLAGEARRGVEG